MEVPVGGQAGGFLCVGHARVWLLAGRGCAPRPASVGLQAVFRTPAPWAPLGLRQNPVALASVMLWWAVGVPHRCLGPLVLSRVGPPRAGVYRLLALLSWGSVRIPTTDLLLEPCVPQLWSAACFPALVSVDE